MQGNLMKEFIITFTTIFDGSDSLEEKERKVLWLLAHELLPIPNPDSGPYLGTDLLSINETLLSETMRAIQENKINNVTLNLIKNRIEQLNWALNLIGVKIYQKKEIDLLLTSRSSVDDLKKNVERLLEKDNANVAIDVFLTEWIDSNGNTLLHHACKCNNEELVKYLLSLDNAVMILNKENINKETPQALAMKHGNYRVFFHLLKKAVEEKVFLFDKCSNVSCIRIKTMKEIMKEEYASITEYYQDYLNNIIPLSKPNSNFYYLEPVFVLTQIYLIIENKEIFDSLLLSDKYSTLDRHPLYLINRILQFYAKDYASKIKAVFTMMCANGYAEGFSYLRALNLNKTAATKVKLDRLYHDGITVEYIRNRKPLDADDQYKMVTSWNNQLNETFDAETCHKYKILNLQTTNSDTVNTKKINAAEYNTSYVYLTEDRTEVTRAHLACNGETPLVFLQHEVQKNPQYLQYRDSAGWTPFHAACAYSPLKVIMYLIDQGAIPALFSNKHQAEKDRILLANAIKTNPYCLYDSFYDMFNSRYYTDVAEAIQALSDSIVTKNYNKAVEVYKKLVDIDTCWYYFNNSAVDNLVKHQNLIIKSLVNLQDKDALVTLIKLLKEDIALRKECISTYAMTIVEQLRVLSLPAGREKIQIVHDVLSLLRDFKEPRHSVELQKNHLAQLVNLLFNQLEMLANSNIYSIEQLVREWPANQSLLKQRSLEEICQSLQSLLNKKADRLPLDLSNIKILLNSPPKSEKNVLQLVLIYGSTEHLTAIFTKLSMQALKQMSDDGALFNAQNPCRINKNNLKKCRIRYHQEIALWDLHHFALTSTSTDRSTFLAMMSTLNNAASGYSPTEEQLNLSDQLHKIIASYRNPSPVYFTQSLNSNNSLSQKTKTEQGSMSMISSVSASLRNMTNVISNIIPAETFSSLLNKLYEMPEDRLIARIEEYATYLQQLQQSITRSNKILPKNLQLIVETLCIEVPQSTTEYCTSNNNRIN